MSSGTTEIIIVADSSPLIGLARIGQLDLLRRSAERVVHLIGTIGLLRRAKRAGWIPELRSQLEALQSNGVYIRQKLIDAVLADVGE